MVKVLLLLIVMTCGCFGTEPFFYASFDHNLNAVKNSRELAPRNGLSTPRVVGVFGHGVLVGGDVHRLEYDAGEMINSQHGTITFWAKPENWTAAVENFVFLVSVTAKNGDDQHDIMVYKFMDSAKLQFLIRHNLRGEQAGFCQENIPWQAGEWHFVALTWDEQNCHFYLDNRLLATCPMIKIPATGWNSLIIGKYSNWTKVGKEKTVIDEVKIYQDTLSKAELKAEFDAGNAVLNKRAEAAGKPLIDRALLYLPFDKSTMPQRGGAKLVTQGKIHWEKGFRNEAVKLGGPNLNSLNYRLAQTDVSSAGTISFWVNPVNWTSTEEKHYLLLSFIAPDFRMMVYKYASEQELGLLFQRPSDTTTTTWIKKSFAWRPNEWHNIVFTYEPGQCALYIDGEPAATGKLTLTVPALENVVLGPGLGWSGNGKGETVFDELVISSRVLSGESVKAQYNNYVKDHPEIRARRDAANKARQQKEQEDLAYSKTGTFALVSSFADTEGNYSDNLIDLLPTGWMAKEAGYPQWADVVFPYQLRVNRVVLQTSPGCALKKVTVLSYNHDRWTEVARSDKISDGTLEVEFEFPEVTTSRIRVRIDAASGKKAQLQEIEVYGPEQPRLGTNQPYWSSVYIWYPEETGNHVGYNPRYFRREFQLDDMSFINAYLQTRANDIFHAYINGVYVGKGNTEVHPFNVTKLLRKGRNVIAIMSDLNSNPGFLGLGSMISELSINYPDHSAVIGTDKRFLTARDQPKNWYEPGFDTSTWVPAIEFKNPRNDIRGIIPFTNTSVKEKIMVKNLRMPTEPVVPGSTIQVAMELAFAAPPKRDYFYMLELGEAPIDRRIVGFKLNRMIFEASGTKKNRLAANLYIPVTAPSGPVPLKLRAIDRQTGVEAEVEFKSPDGSLHPVMVQDRPAPAPADGSASLVYRNHMPGYLINRNEYVVPWFWRYAMQVTPDRLYYHNQSSINVHNFRTENQVVDPDSAGMEREYAILIQEIDNLLRTAPNSWVIIELDLRPTMEWMRANCKEALIDAFGKLGPVSYSSPKYYDDCIVAIDRLIEVLKKQKWYDRIIGFQPFTVGNMDATMGGTANNLFQTDRNKITVGDFNPQSIALFREFLKKKYHDNPTELQVAWKEPGVTFENAYPDVKKIVGAPADGGVFRDPLTSQMALDYAEFLPRVHGNFYRRLAAYLKTKTDHRKLVMLIYGFVIAQLQSYNLPGDPYNNNNFDLSDFLDDNNIDAYVGAPNYSCRWAGQPYIPYFPVASIALHKRLYLADGDYRTFVAGPKEWGRQKSARETEAVMLRDFGYSISNRSAAWFSDMACGDGRRGYPWFAETEVRNTISSLMNLYRQQQARGWESATEVALVLYPEAAKYNDLFNAPIMMNNLIQHMVYRQLNFLGAPYDTLLARDLGNQQVRDYKLYILLNPFYLSDADRNRIEDLKRQGKTIVFLYAPGYLNAHQGCSTEAMTKLTGIKIARKDVKKEIMNGTVTNYNHTITRSLSPGHPLKTIGFNEPISEKLHSINFGPVFYIDDPKATALATYTDGRCSMAVRNFGSWKCVYNAVPFLDSELLRGIARWAGVHLYVDEDIVMSADHNLLTLHNGYGKRRDLMVKLPEKATVFDAMTGQKLTGKVDTFKITLEECQTRILRLDRK